MLLIRYKPTFNPVAQWVLFSAPLTVNYFTGMMWFILPRLQFLLIISPFCLFISSCFDVRFRVRLIGIGRFIWPVSSHSDRNSDSLSHLTSEYQSTSLWRRNTTLTLTALKTDVSVPRLSSLAYWSVALSTSWSPEFDMSLTFWLLVYPPLESGDCVIGPANLY